MPRQNRNGADFDFDDEEFAPSGKATQAQMRQALAMWAAGLEFLNIWVRQWTESRKKALNHAMRELAEANKEPDPDKRVEKVATAVTKYTEGALKALSEASIKAVYVSGREGNRAMMQGGQAMMEAMMDAQRGRRLKASRTRI